MEKIKVNCANCGKVMYTLDDIRKHLCDEHGIQTKTNGEGFCQYNEQKPGC